MWSLGEESGEVKVKLGREEGEGIEQQMGLVVGGLNCLGGERIFTVYAEVCSVIKKLNQTRYVIAIVTRAKHSQIGGYGTKMAPAYEIFLEVLESKILSEADPSPHNDI